MATLELSLDVIPSSKAVEKIIKDIKSTEENNLQIFQKQTNAMGGELTYRIVTAGVELTNYIKDENINYRIEK